MIRASLAIAVLLASASPKPVPNAPPPNPWTMKTDRVDADSQTGAFSAPDNVTITRPDGSIVKADRAKGNYKLKQATLYGDVSILDRSGTFGLKSAQQDRAHGPAMLTADTVRIDDVNRTYDASGHVHYDQGDTKADAEHAHLDDATHVLELEGHVHVVDGDRTLDAEHATYDTVSGAGLAEKNVMVVFPGVTPSIATPKPIHIKGPLIP
jgi:lipopolysaccharide assembly outer membrane protein LptD (OstA)